MPCSDYSNNTYVSPQDRERQNIQARLACEYCSRLEKDNQPIPDWAKEWWAWHKRMDEEQKQYEEQRAAESKAHHAAWLKLTPEERKALKL